MTSACKLGLLACLLLLFNGSAEHGAVASSPPAQTPETPTSAPEQEKGTENEERPVSITLRSAAFEPDAKIPVRYTADGEDVSPPLTWSGVPGPAKQLALICDDPDAPRPEPWVHWVIYALPGDLGSLPENVAKTGEPGTPAGARQGRNSWDRLGYGGPAPPKGHGVHHYHFRIYALSKTLDVAPGATKQELLAAMKGHILAEGELVGTYER